ncbi:MAG: S41 family peptidase [Candidatus Bipolaricaulota bacterium]
MSRVSKKSLACLLIPTILILALSIQSYSEEGTPTEEELKPVLEAYELILSRYYDPQSLDKEKLIRGAIRGMLDKLPDRYNATYTSQEYTRYQEKQDGNYVGLGMEVEKSGDRIRVVATFPGTPASQSSISPLDIILTVDGKSTKNMTFQEAFDALGGEEGTEVKLQIKHPDGSEETIALTREKIIIPPVELELLEGERVALIDINLFNDKTSDRLKEILKQLETGKLSGYIVDLRNNSGGWLNSAVEVASQFVDKGIITKTVTKNEVTDFDSRGNTIPNLPLVVLINKGSASASELVAGAIRDHGMGVLVGRNSFGKGLVQTTHTISGDLKIKLSTAKYLTPDGDNVNEKGLSPDIKTEKQSKDLDAAIRWIQEHLGQLMPLEDE